MCRCSLEVHVKCLAIGLLIANTAGVIHTFVRSVWPLGDQTQSEGVGAPGGQMESEEVGSCLHHSHTIQIFH